MTGAFTCLVTWASIPVLWLHPVLRTAAVSPAVPEKISTKTRSEYWQPETLLENFWAKPRVSSNLRLEGKTTGPAVDEVEDRCGKGKFFDASKPCPGKDLGSSTVNVVGTQTGGDCGFSCRELAGHCIEALHWCAGWAPKHFMQMCTPLEQDCPAAAKSQPLARL